VKEGEIILDGFMGKGKETLVKGISRISELVKLGVISNKS